MVLPVGTGLLGHGSLAGRGGSPYVFDPLHSLNVSYSLQWLNLGDRWIVEGFVAVGLTINIRPDWRYVPAQLFTF